MNPLIYQWIDLLWLPIGFFAAHRHQRVKVLIFIITCILTLRTQVELMDSLHARQGFLPILTMDVYQRGLIVYGVIIALFLILAHFSAGTRSMIFFAASLSIYIFAFCASMLFMIF